MDYIRIEIEDEMPNRPVKFITDDHAEKILLERQINAAVQELESQVVRATIIGQYLIADCELYLLERNNAVANEEDDDDGGKGGGKEAYLEHVLKHLRSECLAHERNLRAILEAVRTTLTQSPRLEYEQYDCFVAVLIDLHAQVIQLGALKVNLEIKAEVFPDQRVEVEKLFSQLLQRNFSIRFANADDPLSSVGIKLMRSKFFEFAPKVGVYLVDETVQRPIGNAIVDVDVNEESLSANLNFNDFELHKKPSKSETYRLVVGFQVINSGDFKATLVSEVFSFLDSEAIVI